MTRAALDKKEKMAILDKIRRYNRRIMTVDAIATRLFRKKNRAAAPF